MSGRERQARRKKKLTASRGRPVSTEATGNRGEEIAQLPGHVRAAMEGSLVGRIRLRIFEEIAGAPSVVPPVDDILHRLRQLYRRSIVIAELEEALLLGSLLSISYSDLLAWQTVGVEELQGMLEDNPWSGGRVLEISQLPQPWPNDIAVVAYGTQLLPAGRLYSLTLITDGPPMSAVARLEVRASREHPEPGISILGPKAKRYRTISASGAHAHPIVDVALRSLHVLHAAPSRRRVSRITLQDPELRNKRLVSDAASEPPLDAECTKRIGAVLRGEMPATEARVALSAVRPFDAQHALNYPPRHVALIAKEIGAGTHFPLLVYWNGSNYVMSDDYGPFLAYKRRRARQIPVVIMGDVPAGSGMIGRRGGGELLPGVTWMPHRDESTTQAEANKWWRRYARTMMRVPPDELLRLHTLSVKLAELVQSPWVRERQLHNFLKKNPVVLDAYGQHVLSEVRLGESYRIDLVIQYDASDKATTLVELERADHAIFTKNGRLRAPVGHAVQQVEDWMRWWRENPEQVPPPLDPSVPLLGMVVVGLRRNLTQDEQRRLLHLNEGQRVKVITYDDLLDRLEQLIAALGREGHHT